MTTSDTQRKTGAMPLARNAFGTQAQRGGANGQRRLTRRSQASRCRFRLLPALALSVLVLAAPADALRADIVYELGDAGHLPATAQVTTGTGALDAIFGRLDRALTDIDMFAVYISDPSAFSATAISPNTDLFDTQLLLFDSGGRGVVANDDTDLSELHATIPLGSVTDAALYYLAIGLPFDVPLSSAGSIFSDPPWGDALVTPTGPGGALPITGWDTTNRLPDPFDLEAYEIRLTGAQFAQPASSVPEPSTAVVFAMFAAMGSAYMSLRRYRRSRTTDPVCR